MFSDILEWDYNSQFVSDIVSKYPIEHLLKHIKEENHKVNLSAKPDENFKILGISNDIGMFDAYVKKGREFKQKYKKVKQGWIAYNPYRINVGSIGIKDENIVNDLISPAYVVFSCKETLLPEYLLFILKSEFGNQEIRNNTTGSVRQILNYDKLCNIRIPILPIDEQKAMMKKYKDLQNEIERLQEALHTHTHNASHDILINNLGIDIVGKDLLNSDEVDVGKIEVVNFKNCDRWDVDFNLNRNILNSLDLLTDNITTMDEVILSTKYGLSFKADGDKNDIPMLRMSNIQNGELDLSNLKYLKVENVGEKYFLNKGDLLFNRTNSKELVGKMAMFDKEGKFTFASYLIQVKVDNKKVYPEYINYIFTTDIVRRQIDLFSRQVTGQVNINSEELRKIKIPLPKLSVQEKIIECMNLLRGEQQDIKNEIESNKFRQFELIHSLVN